MHQVNMLKRVARVINGLNNIPQHLHVVLGLLLVVTFVITGAVKNVRDPVQWGQGIVACLSITDVNRQKLYRAWLARAASSYTHHLPITQREQLLNDVTASDSEPTNNQSLFGVHG